MAVLFDETNFPFPDSLSSNCKKSIGLVIRNARETNGWLAKPSADGKGVDFFTQEEPHAYKGNALFAVFP